MSAIRDEYGAPFAGTVAGTVGANDKMVTGNWRSARPVLNRELCTQCLMCWISCPDACITPDEEAVVHNYEYCKGVRAVRLGVPGGRRDHEPGAGLHRQV